jgi:hypothetical protein
MRFATRNVKHCPFLTLHSAPHSKNDSVWRKIDSSHRPFIAADSLSESWLSRVARCAPTDFGGHMRNSLTSFAVTAAAAIGLLLSPAAAGAQMTSVDPNTAIDSDLDSPRTETPAPPPANTSPSLDSDLATGDQQYSTTPESGTTTATTTETVASAAAPGTTYKKDDLIGAAEGVFGKGAQGLAGLIEDILKKQGEPNAYIVGREAGGALVLGVRYGSGTLFHKIEGEMPAYWTGPSVGFDAGANAGNTFVLVYNLFDTNDLYKRYPAGEGAAYLIGGFNASYLRRGDVVLIPIRVGVGARLGANVGYMKFRKKQNWVPF